MGSKFIIEKGMVSSIMFAVLVILCPDNIFWKILIGVLIAVLVIFIWHEK